MLYLFCSIMLFVSIGHVFKYAERKGYDLYTVLFANYVVAVGLGVFQGDWNTAPHIASGVPLLAAALGILFFGNFVLLSVSISRMGVTIPVAMMRLSAVLPTLASIAFFAEVPELLHLLGIFLAFLCLPLAGREPLSLRKPGDFFKDGFGLALLLFFSTGLTDFLMKCKAEWFPALDSSVLLCMVYMVALLLCAAVLLYRKKRTRFKAVLCGLALGGLNFFGTLFFLLALHHLPGIVVYPVNGVTIIVFTTISGALLWRERLERRHYVFLAIALIAVALINTHLGL